MAHPLAEIAVRRLAMLHMVPLEELGQDYDVWLRTLWPSTFSAPLASYHHEFWAHLQSIAQDRSAPPPPLVAVWPRGWGKSTAGEAAAAYLGPVKGAKYLLYLSDTQTRADDHVANIGRRLESPLYRRYYPAWAGRAVNQFGSSLGWRRARLSTAAGYTIDALGLDTVIRGVKLADERPDALILDDPDQRSDSGETIARKHAALSQDILPALTVEAVVLVLQNLVSYQGIVGSLVSGKAEYLSRRVISGPHPAIENLVYDGAGSDAIITGGQPTWEHMGLAECQQILQRVGLRAFLAECQHDVALMDSPRFALQALDSQDILSPLDPRLLPAHLRVEGLRVYNLPVAGAPYVWYCDPAEGKGRDACATGIMDARTRTLVCVLEDFDRNPQQHAEIGCDLWEWYRCKLGAYERARGEAIAYVLGARGVGTVYQHEDNPLTSQQKAAGLPRRLRPGVPITAVSKRAMIDRLAEALDTMSLRLGDARALKQLASYQVTEHGTQAAAGEHDDLVMMLAGLVLLTDQPESRGSGRRTLSETAGGYSYFEPSGANRR